VVEGSRYRLGDVRLDLPEGAGDIRSELATTRRGVGVSRTRVRRSALEEDRDRVEEGLREAGYLEAQVDAAVVVRDGRRLNVEFPVRPGPRTLVTRVEVEGDPPSAMPPLSIREGGPYSPARVTATAERLREALAAEGFRDARVDGLSGPDPDGGSGRVVVLRADAGPRYRVGGLAVRGALLRGPGTVERVAALPSGEIAAEDRLRRARDEIARIPLLSGARVSVARGDPEAATVVANVQETPRYRFRYGAGYNTEEGPIGTLGLTDAAFLGGARSLSILGRGGRAEHRAEASLRDPFLGPSGASASLYSGREEREGFSFTKRGGLVQMGLLPWSGPSARQDLSVRLVREEIHLMDVEISPEEVPRGARTSSISAVAVSYVWDGRDDLAAPRRGFRLRALGEVAGPVLGGSAQYVKATAEAYAYAPLPASMVLALGVAVGGGEPWGDEEELPLARRFFLGGQQGMRAFDRDDVGPKDPVTGEPLGGEAFHLASAELRAPIRGRLGASLFYERGAVARTVDELGGEPVAMDVGVGVRYQTAAGPVRLEWAREIGGEDESRVFLSFGESF
jgi:outer membrane protein assembly factor BamA